MTKWLSCLITISTWSGVGYMLSPGGKQKVKPELYELKLGDSWFL